MGVVNVVLIVSGATTPRENERRRDEMRRDYEREEKEMEDAAQKALEERRRDLQKKYEEVRCRVHRDL